MLAIDPWIDANMRQLAQEGWIHHLGRHAVACFLTRGDLWLSWEHGAKHFEAELLDAGKQIFGLQGPWHSPQFTHLGVVMPRLFIEWIQLALVILQWFLLPVLQMLFASCISEEERSKWTVHS
jgi:hypothetical protein